MAYGKLMLVIARDTLEDLEHVHLFRGMLHKACLPIELDDIDVSGDVPDPTPRPDPSVEVVVSWDRFMSGDVDESYTGWLAEQLTNTNIADPGPSNRAPTRRAPVRDRNPPEYYSPGSNALRRR